MSGNLPERRSAITSTVTIAGQTYPYKSIHNCHTCQSPYRDQVEQSLLSGMSYQSIVDSIEDLEEGHYPHPNVSSLSQHVKRGHMPIVATTERMLIEQRSRDLGRDIEKHVGTLVDYQTINQIVLQKGMARIANGEISPTMGDVLAAIRQQHTIEQSVGEGLDSEAMQEALYAYMEVARDFIPEDRLYEYGTALSKHPILKALWNKKAIDGDVVSEDE